MAEGEAIARLLNERRPQLRKLRIFVRDLRTYKAFWESSLKKSRKWMSRDLVILSDALDEQLKRYDCRYSHFPAPHTRAGVSILPIFLNRLPLIEGQIFHFVLQLIEHDQFDRLKVCDHCGKWLFAGKKRNKKWCNDSCRLAGFEATEHRKKYNREKAAKTYRATFPDARPYKPRERESNENRKENPRCVFP